MGRINRIFLVLLCAFSLMGRRCLPPNRKMWGCRANGYSGSTPWFFITWISVKSPAPWYWWPAKGKSLMSMCRGTIDAETKKPMTRDSLFRMASMTKPVIGTAMMMMLEEGKIQLGDPVSKYIPEFKDMKVAILQTPGGPGRGDPPKFYTVPAERPITIKDLMTHTSGLSSGPMGQSEAAKVRRQPTETLADYIPRLGSTPLEFQPGTRWMYSPSDGFDVLARIVEIASGMPLNVFLKQRILTRWICRRPVTIPPMRRCLVW